MLATKELFEQLPEAKKHTLRRKYTSLFGGVRTFYRKVAGEVRLLPAEVIFFSNHLNQKQNESTAS
jgi:hypothetical protein